MPDVLKKYTYGGVKVAFVTLEKTVNDTKAAHGLGESETKSVAAAEAVAAVLVCSCKEEGASIAVNIKKGTGSYCAIAENDGRVRGFYEKLSTPVKDGETVLEVTRRLSVRGDYKSVVIGKTTNEAVCEYFKASSQVEARFSLGEKNGVYFALLVEQFPITCEAQEIYRNSAKEEFEYLTEIANGELEKERMLFEKYELVGIVPQKFGCTCTSRSVTEIIKSIPQDEIKAAADADGFIEVTCKFCGKKRRKKVI